MTLHYHGTPITSPGVLETLAGKCFCVSWANPEQLKRCHDIGQSIMLDNGAFTFYRTNQTPNWNDYYKWIEPWLDCPTTWAVIPDAIGGDEKTNSALAVNCPFPRIKMAPVWHLHESLDYLKFLCDQWPKVCFGSSGDYWQVGSESWHRRIGEAFDAVWDRRPWIHMLRGMQCSKMQYPFGSVDSADVARNHHAAKNGKHHAKLMADNWDHRQCPIRWTPQPQHQEIL